MSNATNKTVKLSLVISGIPGYFKLRSKHDDLFRITSISLRDCLDYIESKLPGNVDLHGLYNAYTEETMARRASGPEIDVPFKTIFPKGLHGDSGGLQMVTLGKGTIEKDDRLKIYKTQAEYSHYAMSFDEIPAVFKDDVRYYLPHLVEQKGIESGHNLKEQYTFFKEECVGTDCKIIPIAQGWDIEDTNKFAKGLFAQLTNEEKEALDIVATGFPTSSVYATAKRVFDLLNAEEIPYNAKQHIHLLGVTGFKRLIPALIMIKNGFAPDLDTLSFDSVTLSMSYVMGGVTQTVEEFQQNAPRLKLGKKRTKEIENYWQSIFDFWKDDKNFPFDDVYDMLEHSYYNSNKLATGYQQYEYYIKADDEGNFTEENKKIADYHFAKVLKQEQYYILYQVYNYVMILEEFLEDNIKLEHIFKGKDLELFSALEKVTSNDDFNDWYDYMKKATGFRLNVLDENSHEIDSAADLFFDPQDEVVSERKKAPPRKQKIEQLSDNTETMNQLF